MKRVLLLSAQSMIALSMIALSTHAQGLDLSLPTENDAIYRGDGPAFYQYIERDFQGEKSTPWEGGRYGFVRNPVPTSDGLIYTRFHEGIDIKPMQRDARGEPLDDIRAIADGKVVHANPVAGYSNYGKYIVIEHTFGGCPYYSLYGHLSEIAVTVGQPVSRGERIARMGYTGTGIDRTRAHVHLELNLLFSREFEAWHDRTFRDPNHNGIYNGINLAGLDIARLLLELRKRPDLTIPEFLGEEETFYKVAVPDSPHFELRKRYPWMVSGSANARSWEISFARSGVPLKIEGRAEAVSGPALTYVKKSGVDCSYLTRGTLSGRGANVRLSKSGLDLMKLLIFPD